MTERICTRLQIHVKKYEKHARKTELIRVFEQHTVEVNKIPFAQLTGDNT